MYSNLDLELFKIFWSKELTEGCIFLWRFWYGGIDKILPAKICFRLWKWFHVTYTTMHWDKSNTEYDIYGERKDFEILWHEPTVTDVLKLVHEREDFNDTFSIHDDSWLILYPYHSGGKVKIPYNSYKTLLQQTDDTKQRLINLFK